MPLARTNSSAAPDRKPPPTSSVDDSGQLGSWHVGPWTTSWRVAPTTSSADAVEHGQRRRVGELDRPVTIEADDAIGRTGEDQALPGAALGELGVAPDEGPPQIGGLEEGDELAHDHEPGDDDGEDTEHAVEPVADGELEDPSQHGEPERDVGDDELALGHLATPVGHRVVGRRQGRRQGDEEEPDHPAGVHDVAEPVGVARRQVGEAAVADGEEDQPAAEEGQHDAPPPAGERQRGEHHGGQHDVGGRVGERDHLGEGGLGAGVDGGSEGRRPTDEQQRRGDDQPVEQDLVPAPRSTRARRGTGGSRRRPTGRTSRTPRRPLTGTAPRPLGARTTTTRPGRPPTPRRRPPATPTPVGSPGAAGQSRRRPARRPRPWRPRSGRSPTRSRWGHRSRSGPTPRTPPRRGPPRRRATRSAWRGSRTRSSPGSPRWGDPRRS